MTNEPTHPLPEGLVIALRTTAVDIELLHQDGEWSKRALLEILHKHLAAPIQELLNAPNKPCALCGKPDADNGGVWVETPTEEVPTKETWMCGGCVSLRIAAAEEATLSDIRKFFGDTCTMQEAPALRLFADYDIAHPYRKIGALARIIAEAESRGRDAGLEEATTAKIVTGRGETVLVPSYLKDAIRALKTSAAKREETQ